MKSKSKMNKEKKLWIAEYFLHNTINDCMLQEWK